MYKCLIVSVSMLCIFCPYLHNIIYHFRVEEYNIPKNIEYISKKLPIWPCKLSEMADMTSLVVISAVISVLTVYVVTTYFNFIWTEANSSRDQNIRDIDSRLVSTIYQTNRPCQVWSVTVAWRRRPERWRSAQKCKGWARSDLGQHKAEMSPAMSISF